MQIDSEELTKAQRAQIMALLEELPPERLEVVEQFVRFLRQQAEREKPTNQRALNERFINEVGAPYRYPTVAVPAESMKPWLNLISEGYDGDALEDTEALYDDA